MTIHTFYFNSKLSLLVFSLLTITVISKSNAQTRFAGKEELLSTPKQYTVFFNSESPKIDGKLDDVVWKNVEWTENFKDIEAQRKPLPTWNTRAKMTWDDKGLYIAAELLDPHVWAYLKNYDDNNPLKAMAIYNAQKSFRKIREGCRLKSEKYFQFIK